MYDDLLQTAIRAAEAGATVLRSFFRKGDLEVGSKRGNDLVSEADRASESAVLATLRKDFPDHRILAEEGGFSDGDAAEFEWIVDPLDGTANFVHGLPIYAVSVACRHRGELVVGVVHDPEGANLFAAAAGRGATWNGDPMRMHDKELAGAFVATGFPFRAHPALDLFLDVFRAVFLRAGGVRRCGAAALDLAYTAAGVYDAFFEFRLAPWDVAAGAVLIREAGGAVSDLDGGQEFLRGGNIVAGSPRVQHELRALVAGFTSEAELERLVPYEDAETLPDPIPAREGCRVEAG